MKRHLRPWLAIASIVLLATGGGAAAPPRAAGQHPASSGPTPPPPPALSVTKFLAFGDSMTEGVFAEQTRSEPSRVVPAESYPAKLQAMLTRRYVSQTIDITNAGKGGEQAEDGVDRLPDLLAAHKPEVVLLMEGVNDLAAYGGDALQPTLDHVAEMVRQARASGAKAMIATLPPEWPGGFRTSAIDFIVPFNEALRKVAASEEAILVDVYAAFDGDLALLGSDGLHPTEAGYERIARAFFLSIRANFEIPATTGGS